MARVREKVVVAMSGGVDSSVAASLLVEQGFEVIGLFMRHGVKAGETPSGIGTPRDGGAPHGHKPAARAHQGCCSASDASDARFVAGLLGIAFYALNFEDEFDQLIDYFADEYARGRTPNPCVICNDRLKFGKIVEYADAVGARYIATGHYARTEVRAGRQVLLRAADARKDQSYVLFGLRRDVLDRVLFPIGELTKDEVRGIAARCGFPNHDKPDSVEICFVPDRRYASVVQRRRPEAFVDGNVVDQTGRIVGRHTGLPQFTIGQRRGLGIAAGSPIYVTGLNVEDNTVTVGDAAQLESDSLVADRVHLLADPRENRFRADVKIRYLHEPVPSTVELLDDGMARVVFDRPQRAVTPGQAVVFYEDDRVLGGGWIERGERKAEAPAEALQTA